MIRLTQVIDELAAVVKKLDCEVVAISHSFSLDNPDLDDKWLILVQGETSQEYGDLICKDIRPTGEEGIGTLFTTWAVGNHLLIETVKEVWYEITIK